MTIQFIPPNPEQKRALEELENLLAILNKPITKELKQNKIFVKYFTKALFLAGKSYKKQPVKTLPKVTHEVRGFDQSLQKNMEEIQIPNLPSIKSPIPQAPRIPSAPKPLTDIIPEQPAQIQDLNNFIIEGNILKFNILEPVMESLDWKIFSIVKNDLKEKIISNPNILQNQNFLMEEIQKTCKELKIKYSDNYLQKIKYYLTKYLKGYGKIDPLIQDSNITEIIASSYSNIQVRYKNELLNTNIAFDSNEELDNFLINLAEKSGKSLSDSNPELNINFQGLRIEAFYNPIMGSKFTIRKQ